MCIHTEQESCGIKLHLQEVSDHYCSTLVLTSTADTRQAKNILMDVLVHPINHEHSIRASPV